MDHFVIGKIDDKPVIMCNVPYKDIFHVHTWRCKHAGSFADSEYIDRAIELGAKKITFTDHAPFPGDPFGNRMDIEQLPEYIVSINRLKEDHKGIIEVCCGLEIEYLPSYSDYYKELRSMDGIDHLLLGQHFYEISKGVYSFSLPLKEKYSLEAKGCSKAMIEGIQTGYFNAVAHPDRIFRRRKLWDKDMDRITNKIIAAASNMGIPLEMNESSLLCEHQFWTEFWEQAERLKAPVIYGLDAHTPEVLQFPVYKEANHE